MKKFKWILLVVTVLIISILAGCVIGNSMYEELEGHKRQVGDESTPLVINTTDAVKQVMVYGPDHDLLLEATGKVTVEETKKEIVVRFTE